MRLISCYILGFGNMKKTSINFDENYSVFVRQNGWGKSTLAVFIRVMFYGFEGENRRNDIDNERKRYRPWTGDGYGGEIVFEACGKRYRMQRTFGIKRGEDIYSLYDADTNLKSDDFSGNIGEELFQIDSESFERTVFIGQTGMKTGATDAINVKIGNMEKCVHDLDNYEEASTELKNIINAMSPHKKNGKLYKEKAELMRVRELVRTYPGKKARFEALCSEKKRIIHDMAGNMQIQENSPAENERSTYVLCIGVLCLFCAFVVLGVWRCVQLRTYDRLSAILILGGIAGLMIAAVVIRHVKRRYNYIHDSEEQPDKTQEQLELRLAECTEEIAELKLDLANIRDSQLRLEEMESSYARRLHEYELTRLTYDILRESKEKFVSRYAAPVRKIFGSYYHQITGGNADDFLVDANLDVQYIEDGMYRDTELMSGGQNDVVNFCMRISFIEAMYKDERPFIILDDPFVNIDDVSFEGIRRALQLMAERYQIIYFTCSENRRITL